MANDKGLRFSTPETQGVPSQAIVTFLQEIEQKQVCLHSFMLIRHGEVIAEGYWPPFSAEKPHRMYSISKSFASVAVGLLCDDGKISLSDKVADFFPEYLPQNPHPLIMQATVRDLLMMATFNVRTSYSDKDFDWVKTFFNMTTPLHPSGTVFSYDTAATVTLSALVEKVTGMPFLEYMYPRVLGPIGIGEGITCIKSPDGRAWSGSGVLCTTRDLARFAIMCMNHGAYEGKQLVSREYMQAATSKQIENSVTGSGPEVQQGYGYQFWCLREGGFACRGMGGQFALCMPKYDAILITTADVQAHATGVENIHDAFFRLLGKMGDALSPNPAEQAALSAKINSLAMPLPKGEVSSSNAAAFSGKKYAMESNAMGIEWIRLNFANDKAVLEYENATGEHSLTLGLGQFARQPFPEKYYGEFIGRRDKNYDSLAAAAWADNNTLTAVVYAIDDYVGTIKMQFTFKSDMLSVYMIKAAEWFFDEYQGFAWGKECL